MLTSIAAGGLGALLTIAIGGPLAARLANVQVWRRAQPADQFSQREVFAPRNFEPLDFGPDDMLWPSESARTLPPSPVPRWPSESWEDADFGRGPGARAEEILEKNAARQAQDTQRRERRSGSPSRQAAARPAPPPRGEVARKPAPAPRPVQQRPAKQRSPAERVQQARPAKTRPTPPPPTAQSATDQPDRAQIERMIGDMGLAGTVQHLMRENGWDFKTAAAWLARARKS